MRARRPERMEQREINRSAAEEAALLTEQLIAVLARELDADLTERHRAHFRGLQRGFLGIQS